MDFSLVIPVYNSQDSLSELNERITETLDKTEFSYQIIYVDDNSKDKSWSQLRSIKEKNDTNRNITIIRLNKNIGQHQTVICGIHEALGDTIVTIDDDLEHRPEDIVELIKEFINKKYDVLYGVPANKYRSQFRNVTSKIAKFLLKYGAQGYGEGSGFRIIKSRVAKEILLTTELFTSIDVKLNRSKLNMGSLELNFSKRKYGKSNYSTIALIKLLWHILSIDYRKPMIKWCFLLAAFEMVVVVIGYLIHRTDPGFFLLSEGNFYIISLVLILIGLVQLVIAGLITIFGKRSIQKPDDGFNIGEIYR